MITQDTKEKSLHILLVEDNEGDILLTTETLEELSMTIRLSIAKNGKEAIDFMNREMEQGNEKPVGLVLLDINLPKKNGHEVLSYIRENNKLDHIPVFMLTTSSFPKDMDMALKNAADGYLVKPLDPYRLSPMLKLLKETG